MKDLRISVVEEIFFTLELCFFQCFIFLITARSALENLSSLEKKYSEQAKTIQQEMLVLQKNAEGIVYLSIMGLARCRWQVTLQTRWIKYLPFVWTLQLNVWVFSAQAGYWSWPKPFFQDEWQLTNYLPIIPKKMWLGSSS